MAGRVRDIPFIARRSTRDPADTRRRLGIAGDRPVVLPSFGGYGATLPLAALRRSPRFTLLAPVAGPPRGPPSPDPGGAPGTPGRHAPSTHRAGVCGEAPAARLTSAA